MQYTDSYQSIVEPFDSTVQRVEEIQKLEAEISRQLRLGEAVETNIDLPEGAELSIHHCVAVCIWFGLEETLQKYFNQEIEIPELCDSIAAQVSTEIYEERTAS